MVLDDEPLALKQLESYVKNTDFLELTGSFSNGKKALEFLSETQVDLMFVDIQMPDINGLEFANSLPYPSKIVFTTAFRKYALEGFQLDAADYLLKPIAYEEFLKSVEKIRDRYFLKQANPIIIEKTEQFLYIKSEYRILRIDFDHIEYIESKGDYIRIFLENKKPIMALMSMKKVVEYLPEEKFMRIHRSFIVNLSKITVIERNRIIFHEETYLPVSSQYKEVFQDYLDNHFMK